MVRFVCLLSLLLLSACETSFEVEVPEHEPMLVVNSLFTAGDTLSVYVERSYGFGETPVPGRTEVSVSVYEGDVLVERLALDSTRNTYRAAGFIPVAGHAYTVRASAPGFDPVEATDMVPEAPDAEVSVRRLPERADSLAPGHEWYEVTLRLDDPGSRENYYALSVHNIEYSEGRPTPYNRFSGYPGFRSADPVVRDGNLSEFWHAQEVRYDVAPFSDRAIDGKTHEIRLTVQVYRPTGKYQGLDRIRYFLKLRAISEPYYRYLKARLLSEIDNPLAEPVQLPSNIRGGLGIFAAANEREFPIVDITLE